MAANLMGCEGDEQFFQCKHSDTTTSTTTTTTVDFPRSDSLHNTTVYDMRLSSYSSQYIPKALLFRSQLVRLIKPADSWISFLHSVCICSHSPSGRGIYP